MAFANWDGYIDKKTAFYGKRQPVARTDTEFTWGMTTNAPTWRRHVKSVPLLGPFLVTRKLRQSNPVAAWDAVPAADKQAMHEVRDMLADEISRIMFDEAIVLRNVSHHRYFATRHAFEPLAEQKLAFDFAEPGYPRSYLGLPIRTYRLVVASREVQVVAADKFPDMLNIWQQYLIKRDGIDFTPPAGDVVFDCGACVGDVSTVFAAMVGPAGKVYGFDPVPLHLRFCALQQRNNLTLAQTLEFVPKAVGNENRVAANKAEDRTEISPGELDIKNFAMTTLDSFVAERGIPRVSLIKMDIEGAERDALRGADKTIRTFKPKLAISTYHKPDDFWTIPLQIRDMDLGYRFAFDHHSPRNWESVIYAY